MDDFRLKDPLSDFFEDCFNPDLVEDFLESILATEARILGPTDFRDFFLFNMAKID